MGEATLHYTVHEDKGDIFHCELCGFFASLRLKKRTYSAGENTSTEPVTSVRDSFGYSLAYATGSVNIGLCERFPAGVVTTKCTTNAKNTAKLKTGGCLLSFSLTPSRLPYPSQVFIGKTAGSVV